MALEQLYTSAFVSPAIAHKFVKTDRRSLPLYFGILLSIDWCDRVGPKRL